MGRHKLTRRGSLRLFLGLFTIAAVAVLGVGAAFGKVPPLWLIVASLVCIGALAWVVKGPHPE